MKRQVLLNQKSRKNKNLGRTTILIGTDLPSLCRLDLIEAIEALEKGIHSGRIGNALDERFFNAHLQLGIAHYSNGNWCGAAKSWARAKMMADSESTNYLFPDAFEVYLNYAENRLDSE